MSAVGRNDPCLCGSGKKYKKCCLTDQLNEVSTSGDFVWRKIRKLDDVLNGKILKYFSSKYRDLMGAAWAEFHVFNDDRPEIDIKSPVFICAFLPWLLYNWVPDDADVNIDTDLSVPVAEAYLCLYNNILSRSEKDFIVENLKSHYSYYEILSIVKGHSLRIRDILRNREFTIHEKAGSESASLGYVLMARVVTIPECNVFCGVYPFNLPTQFTIDAVRMKQHYQNGDWKDEDLWSFGAEIRKLFLQVLTAWQNPKTPKITNTDGEDMLPSKLFFDLHCSCEVAFDKLATLGTPTSTKEELLRDDVTYSEDGSICEVFLSWIAPSNKSNKSLNSIVFASMKISNNKLVVDVNSQERAEKAKTEICKLMGELVSYKTMEITSIESAIKNPPGKSKIIDLNKNPEAKKAMQKIHEQHWRDWLDMDIPALDGKTPKEAAKTKSGKERLEALFSDFHQRNLAKKESDSQQMPVDLAFLRKELDMT